MIAPSVMFGFFRRAVTALYLLYQRYIGALLRFDRLFCWIEL